MKFEMSSKMEKGFEKLTDEWDKRMDGLVEHLPARLAEALLEELLKKAPKDVVEGYPDFMAVRKISAEIDGHTVYGVLPPGWAFAQRVRKIDADTTVLYVRPKITGREADPAAVALAQHNPWTVATIPYEPSRAEASILSRRVSLREANKIAQQRTVDRKELIAQLREMGKTIKPADKMLERKVTRDLFFEITRAEFGVETAQKSHWKPATQALTGVIARKIISDAMESALDPSDNDLLRSVKSYPDARKSVVKQVQRFQDLVVPK